MKSKSTRLPDELAGALEEIARTHRTSEGRVLEIGLERLVAEVKKTGRLPLPKVNLEPAASAS